MLLLLFLILCAVSFALSVTFALDRAVCARTLYVPFCLQPISIFPLDLKRSSNPPNKINAIAAVVCAQMRFSLTLCVNEIPPFVCDSFSRHILSHSHHRPFSIASLARKSFRFGICMRAHSKQQQQQHRGKAYIRTGHKRHSQLDGKFY